MAENKNHRHTLAHFRKLGHIVFPTQTWHSFARRNQDLMGFVDVVSIATNGWITFTQATSWDHISDRVRKILDDEKMRQTAFRLCLRNSVCVVGWKQEGGKHSLWIPKWRYLTPKDFADEVPEWKPTTEPTEHSDTWFDECVLPNVPSLKVHDPQSGGSPNALS